MIVRGMNLNTTEEGVRKAFQFITNFPIQEIRFIRDNVGKFRGFCFIKWKSTEVNANMCVRVWDVFIC